MGIPEQEVQVRKLIDAAEKLGREMVADMADQAALIHRQHGDEHGATVLADFGKMVRDDKEPAGTIQLGG